MDRQSHSGTQIRSIGGRLSFLLLTLLWHSQPLQAQPAPAQSSPTAAPAAASFPQRPLTLVVPFPPGGGTDTTARLLAKRLSDNLGQQVLIDNKPGGGGVAGAVAVRNAPADGHTLFIGHVGTHAIDIHLHSKLGYDPVADFTPISSFMSFLSLLVVPANSPARNLPSWWRWPKASLVA
jgi:tripartite-type tricarboxylate transporter receptor subunit TctC